MILSFQTTTRGKTLLTTVDVVWLLLAGVPNPRRRTPRWLLRLRRRLRTASLIATVVRLSSLAARFLLLVVVGGMIRELTLVDLNFLGQSEPGDFK